MRILFFHPLTGYLWRGIERNVVSLASTLVQQEHDVSILTLHHREQALLSELDPRVRCYQAPYSRYYSYQCGVPFFVAHLLRHEYDAIVVFFGGFGVGASLAATRRILTPRYFIYLGYPVDVAPHRYDELDRWKLPPSAAGLWAHGEHVALQAQHRFNFPVVPLPTGVDTQRFVPNAEVRERTRTALGLSTEQPLILTVSALDERKGIQYVLDAMPRILEAIPTVRYVIAGDGEYAPRLKQQILERGLQSAVTMLGARSQVEELYPAADVFCLLARGEAGPNVVYEALSAGVPVVTLAAPHLTRHLTPDAVEFMQDTSTDAVAESLIALLRDSTRRERIGRIGRDLVARHYSFSQLALQITDLIQSSSPASGLQKETRIGRL